MRAVAILPARLASTRLARKMLLAETGQALFLHAARNVIASGVFQRVVVATDAEEIFRAARSADVEAVMTDPRHASGTDRIREALERLDGASFDVVVNVQGDEPELAHGDLAALVAAFGDRAVAIATLAGPVASDEEARAPHVVKVVCDANGDALYFSRAPIPSQVHARAGAATGFANVRRHIGVYGFRPAALRRFCELAPGRLEALENLEQLRWLEAGERMRVVPSSSRALGIDTREDYDAFVARIRSGRGRGAQ
jgi:3-deoxy-manno-octulosonate cytidylyltransferase (CMP-KDO synthetase)